MKMRKKKLNVHCTCNLVTLVKHSQFHFNIISSNLHCFCMSGPDNRATEGSNPKGTRLYFVISLKNVEKIFDWH